MSSRRRRSGGRAARAAARAAARREMEKSPFLTSNLAPYEVLSTEGLEIIENNAEIILERVGVDITDDRAVKDFADAGADVEGTRVRFPRGMCRRLITATAPSSFTQVARNPQRSVVIGGKNMVSGALPTALPSSGTWKEVAATPRWRTSTTSSSWLTCLPSSITREGRFASRWTYQSPSATSTWCTPTCVTRTSLSWAR